jgi:hypothetical protein
MSWDESKADHNTVANWLLEQFPLTLWEHYNSVLVPIVYCLFSAEDMHEATKIAKAIRQQEFVKNVTISISKLHRYFGGLRDKCLSELIAGQD